MSQIKRSRRSREDWIESQEILRNTALILLIVAASIACYLFIPTFQNFVNQAISAMKGTDELKTFVHSFKWYAPLIILLLTLLQGIVFFIPLFLIMIVSTMVFGLFLGVVISLISQIIVGYLIFKLTKFLGRPFVKHYVKRDRLSSVDTFMQRNGLFGVLVARMIPLGSFDIVNFAAGLLNVKDRDFLIGTAIGALPATLFYGLIGANILSARHVSIWTILALTTLIVFFIFVWVWFFQKIRKRKTSRIMKMKKVV